MLTEQQCEKIEKGLTAQVEPRRVAAYLCLHMGLTLAEAAALRVRLQTARTLGQIEQILLDTCGAQQYNEEAHP